MKKRNEKLVTTLVNESGENTYYAPAASTFGKRVRIYRYAFEKVLIDYKRQVEETESPFKKSLIRHQWANFIIEHLEEYSGDRRFMKELAKGLMKEALTTIRHEFRRVNANIETAKQCHRITDVWLYEQELSEMNALCPKALLDQIYDFSRRWVA